jgi:hypothetical protein
MAGRVRHVGGAVVLDVMKRAVRMGRRARDGLREENHRERLSDSLVQGRVAARGRDGQGEQEEDREARTHGGNPARSCLAFFVAWLKTGDSALAVFNETRTVFISARAPCGCMVPNHVSRGALAAALAAIAILGAATASSLSGVAPADVASASPPATSAGADADPGEVVHTVMHIVHDIVHDHDQGAHGR